MPEPLEEEEVTPLDDEGADHRHREADALARQFIDLAEHGDHEDQEDDEAEVHEPGEEARAEAGDLEDEGDFLGGDDFVEHSQTPLYPVPPAHQHQIRHERQPEQRRPQ